MNKQGNVTPTKLTNKVPITNPRDMESYQIFEEKNQNNYLKKFSEPQKNTDT